MTKAMRFLLAGGGAALIALIFWPAPNPSAPAADAQVLAKTTPQNPESPASAKLAEAPPTIDATPMAKQTDTAGGIRVLLAPEQETTLVSQIAGRITAINVGLGGGFSKGSTLISFDCQEQQARIRMSEAELDSARQTHEAKLRLQGLDQAGEVEVSLAASAVEKSVAQVALYRAQMTQCAVVAPFSGRAVKLNVKAHQGVTAGQPLIEIVSTGALKLRLNAPADWVVWLKIGTPFEVAIDETGKRYSARITALNGRIDAVSQTIELEARVAGTHRELLPGMSGTALFSPPN